MTEQVRFKAVVRRLHAEKDAAYGSAWKRRGELISVLANLARKVDRLEQVAAGGPVTRDESVLDTAVDLLVYNVKYQTYLAGQDGEAASRLFGETAGPFSEGRAGFETLDALDLSALDDDLSVPAAAEASAAVVVAFNDLERFFEPGAAPAPAGERFNRAITLTVAAVEAVAAIRRETPTLYHDFLHAWKRTPNARRRLREAS